jgi:hypothetical protein
MANGCEFTRRAAETTDDPGMNSLRNASSLKKVLDSAVGCNDSLGGSFARPPTPVEFQRRFKNPSDCLAFQPLNVRKLGPT